MKKIVLISIISSYLILNFHNVEASEFLQQATKGWKAGIARIVITPEQSMWLAGYGGRDHASEGTIHDLWAKALVLEDASGKQVVLVTTDLLGFPKNMSDRIRDQLNSKFHLSRAQVILSSSHTHSGPVLQNALFDVYPLDMQERTKIEQYSNKLEDQIVALVGKALNSMKPVQIFAQNGVTRFQVNRRTNVEATLDRQTYLNGPNDFAVPVIKVLNEAGELIAVAFGYACHATVLDIYKWSGDYPGFAQLELEKSHPGVTALFFQGAGADMNPLPRRSVTLAQQYGRELAAAVERVLSEDMRKLPSKISTAYSEVELSLNTPPTKEELSKIAEQFSDFHKRWAMHMLEIIGRGESLRTSYPYPVQVWMLGDQPIIILGGELVIDYAIQLKRIFGLNIFVMGYSNDVMAYIPSVRVIREGGYETAASQIIYGLPATWKANIETLIFYEVLKTAEKAGVPQPESKLIEK
jgi:neutral ceramidase